MARKKTQLTNIKENKKREQRRLRNINYRQKLKDDPSKAEKYKKVKEDAKRRKFNYTEKERQEREKDPNYKEASQALWRLEKRKKISTTVEVVDWSEFEKENLEMENKRQLSQQNRRRKERKIQSLNTQNLKEKNERLLKKVMSLRTQLSRKRKAEESLEQKNRDNYQRAKAAMPSTPLFFAETITKLMSSASPSHKTAVKEVLKKRFGRAKKLSKLFLSSNSSTTKKTVESLKRAKIKNLDRKRQLRVWKYRVRQFLENEENSRILVGQTIIDKELTSTSRKPKCWSGRRVQKLVLRYKLVDLYEMMKLKYQNFPYKLKTFCKLRPKHIVPAKYGTKKAKCVCTIHSNIDRKLTAINKMCKENHLEHLVVSNSATLNLMTMCAKKDKSEFNAADCIFRQCTSCGPEMVLDHFAELIELHKSTMISWTMWQNVKRNKLNKKTGLVTEKQYNEVTSMATSVNELFTLLLKELSTFSGHIFRAKWQWKQLRSLQATLPIGHSLIIADFSENMRIEFSEETIASHVSPMAITLFVIALYRHASDSTENNRHILFENINIFSNSQQHDSHLVHHFLKVFMQHCNRFPEQQFQILHRYTDGCSSQFRSRHCMRDVSYFREDHGVDIVCNFGETAEFKNITDGLGGVIKQLVKNSILSDPDLVLSSHEKLLQYVKQKFEFHINPGKDENCGTDRRELDRRVFYFVHDAEVERNRPDRLGKQLPGILQIRCAASQEPGFVKFRNLTCYCSVCLERSGKDINIYISSADP